MATPLNPNSRKERGSKNPVWDRVQKPMEGYYLDLSQASRDALFEALHREVLKLAVWERQLCVQKQPDAMQMVSGGFSS